MQLTICCSVSTCTFVPVKQVNCVIKGEVAVVGAGGMQGGSVLVLHRQIRWYLLNDRENAEGLAVVAHGELRREREPRDHLYMQQAQRFS
jgi:hypothetical protein